LFHEAFRLSRLILRALRRFGMVGAERSGCRAVHPMAVLSTNLVAVRTRELADMIETLPVSLSPEHQYQRCCELLEQVAVALDLLSAATPS